MSCGTIMEIVIISATISACSALIASAITRKILNVLDGRD